MSRGSAICLNMIVKNEMANLERCLGAVAPHIDCWVIGDTGSTDGTQDYIREFFAKRGVPGELHEFPFHNFEQARNEALRCAYASPLAFDYLLFDDADMELVVDAADFRQRLTAPGYRLLQRSVGGLSYWNTRLVRRDVGAWYHGVTHEYLDVPGGTENLSEAWYRDYASGSNRVDKFERDARLLREALEKDPGNHRYWFYLAQSYYDAGRLADAAEAYAKRADMGGWIEEAWKARVRLARCLRRMDDDAGFVRTALAAFNERPWRAEPLFDLANYYRRKGDNHASSLFAERGLDIPMPADDILFVEDWVYRWALREEFSIAANYAKEPERKARGFAACDSLALDRGVPERARDLARSNLRFYVGPAAALTPSFSSRPVGFSPPEGYAPTNPSVVRRGDALWLVQRAVNYRVDETQSEGAAERYPTHDGGPIRTRNFLLRLSDDLAVAEASEILEPVDLPPPQWDLVQGFEDLRPFAWRGGLWASANVRQLNAEGVCEQVLARLEPQPGGDVRLVDWRVVRPEGPQRHEKNWMPGVAGDDLRFLYLCDPTRAIDAEGRTIAEEVPPIAAEAFRGGSQLVPFGEGRLALIHEVGEENGRRQYRHRWVWFDADWRLRRVSQPFYFNVHGIEFAAGLAWHPDGRRLVVSYGVADQEAWLATVESCEVAALLQDVDRLPTGARSPAGPPALALELAVEAAAPARPAMAGATTGEAFRNLAPFLKAANSPRDRREQSRAFDARIAPLLHVGDASALPQIHAFYEVLRPDARHDGLIAAVRSQRAAGHPVKVWTYTPDRLAFLQPFGVELADAAEVVPAGLYDRIVAGSEIRYFSDVFRYAVLYEHGGLWMDSDVVLLRPFPFRGEHFFNLQWRPGVRDEHFICGNVIYAKPQSRHLRALYEMSLDLFISGRGRAFGDVGPKLLSDYVASDAGAELRDQVFSPMFFNAIDWTESDRFDRPIDELADYLNDERVFGLHMWTARHSPAAEGESAKLISMLSEPLANFPRFSELADRFNTDKNRRVGNRHGYARVYEKLLSDRRLSLRRLLEVGLCRGLAEGRQNETPSVDLWQAFFPFAEVIGADVTDFSAFERPRFTAHVCDQSEAADLRRLREAVGPGTVDVIVDDGSHASHDQQLTLRELFPLLADGGWYFIEGLDWQPPGEDRVTTSLTKTLLREIHEHGRALGPDPLDVGGLADQFAEILFFDSHYEVSRAGLQGGVVAIRKRDGRPLSRGPGGSGEMVV